MKVTRFLVLSLAMIFAGKVGTAETSREIFATKKINLVEKAMTLPISSGSIDLKLDAKYCLEVLELEVQSQGGSDSSAEISVNGGRVGHVYAPGRDPFFPFSPERVTDRVTLRALPVEGPEGTLQINRVTAWVSDEKSPVCQRGSERGRFILASERRIERGTVDCQPCQKVGIKFPTYYSESVMANVAQQAIFLVDELFGYTNHKDQGEYLLPIKKAAAKARAMGTRWGDASGTARVDYEWLLETLDNAEDYIDDNFERGYVFELAEELLSLREYIRRVLT